MTVTRDKNEPRKLPMMPIRDMVIFPYMMTPFVVGRESSVRALEEALSGDRKIFLATQHDASIDEPKAKDIYQVGSICSIVQSVKMPDGNIKVLVEGVERAKSIEVTDRDGFFVATVRTGKRDFEVTPAAEQLMQRVTTLFENYVKLQQSLNDEKLPSLSVYVAVFCRMLGTSTSTKKRKQRRRRRRSGRIPGALDRLEGGRRHK